MRPALACLAAVPFILACVALTIGAIHAGEQNEREVRELCDRLGAEFVPDPRWMCVRDGSIVYGGK